jgi:hypothetical protein
MCASQEGRAEVAQLLVAAKADVHARSRVSEWEMGWIPTGPAAR